MDRVVLNKFNEYKNFDVFFLVQMDTSGPYFDIVKQDAEINSRLVLFKVS